MRLLFWDALMRYAEGKASRPEGIRIESMPLQNCHPLKFWENYSAFANSGGGSIRVYNAGGFDTVVNQAFTDADGADGSRSGHGDLQ